MDDKGSVRETRRSTRLFFSGVFILTVANIVNKVLGVFMKVPLQRIVGSEGMGYFYQAYTVYTCLFMISTTGLPTAVSLLISEARARGKKLEAKRIYNVTLALFAVVGIIGTVIMMLGADAFSVMTESPNARMSIIFLGPTMFFICITSALRGYFQGYQHMTPTAISQLIETVMKVVVGIIFALWAKDQGYGIEYVAAYAILGVTVGVALGMVFLLFSKWFFREEKYDEEYYIEGMVETVSPCRSILKRLVVIAVPITISASMLSLTEMIDLVILMDRLVSIGHNEETANTLYGAWKSCVVPLFDLPPALIYPISYSLIPMIKATITQGDEKRTSLFMHTSLRISSIMAVPCALGMSVMAHPIIRMLFGKEDADMGAPLLTILAPAIFFVCLLSVTNALLQASGYERKPIISMVAGAIVKLVLTYILVGISEIGMNGVPISTFFCYLTVSVFNVYFLVKYVHIKLDFGRMFVKPVIAGAACAVSAWGVYYLLSLYVNYIVSMFLGIVIGAVVYAILIFATKAISGDDIRLIPKGEKILAKFSRIKA